MSIESQDDQVLAQLYKKGAKETPSPELDRKILDYAAQKNTPAHGSSHFGGGWKVPLSLAASVILVFAILVQLDRSPEQLEMPPIPTSDKSDVKSVPMDELKTDDFSRSIGDKLATDRDIGFEAEDLSGRIETQAPSTESPSKLESRKKRELKETKSQPETTLEQSRQYDDYRLNNELELEQIPAESPPVSSPSAKPKASNVPAPVITRPTKTPERMQELSKDASRTRKSSTDQDGLGSANGAAVESVAPERAISVESNQTQQTQAGEDASIEEEADFVPMPVEDWLLLIEQLLARKDYAEAARQLEKFKQAHPTVNVDDLESKIP